jgi:hypothetical protein
MGSRRIQAESALKCFVGRLFFLWEEQTMACIEMASLKLGEITLLGKGAKVTPLTSNGGILKWTPGPLQILFQPKAFNDPTATRVSVCFKSTSEIEDYIEQLEAWILKEVSSNPQMYLGQACSEAQVRERFTSALKTSEKGCKHLRAKMNLAGKGQVRVWDENRRPRQAPEDWTMCEVQPCLIIKGLWVMSKDFGLLIEMADALVSESSQLCPF